MVDYEQTGLITTVDFRRVVRKLKGPILEPDEIRLFCEKIEVIKNNNINYKDMIVFARKKFETSGMAGSNLQKVCAKIKKELEYRKIDIVELMKMYDKGNGRVRITALIQELKDVYIYIMIEKCRNKSR